MDRARGRTHQMPTPHSEAARDVSVASWESPACGAALPGDRPTQAVKTAARTGSGLWGPAAPLSGRQVSAAASDKRMCAFRPGPSLPARPCHIATPRLDALWNVQTAETGGGHPHTSRTVPAHFPHTSRTLPSHRFLFSLWSLGSSVPGTISKWLVVLTGESRAVLWAHSFMALLGGWGPSLGKAESSHLYPRRHP